MIASRASHAMERRQPIAKEPKTLGDLFHATLKDIWFAEKRILSTLPKMEKAAQNEEIKAAFEKHRGETERQIERLDEVFAIIEKKPQTKPAPLLSASLMKAGESYRNTGVRRHSTLGCSPRPRRWSTTRFRATAR